MSLIRKWNSKEEWLQKLPGSENYFRCEFGDATTYDNLQVPFFKRRVRIVQKLTDTILVSTLRNYSPAGLVAFEKFKNVNYSVLYWFYSFFWIDISDSLKAIFELANGYGLRRDFRRNKRKLPIRRH